MWSIACVTVTFMGLFVVVPLDKDDKRHIF